ncbi:MHC class II transactivator isoform X2 [Trachemys scripta elegans]|uniref:MHC class II transactivator isoform X2 n=1 Tax=Trachemys scripta elegans TaxID=31138 RepID=UPI0015540423|nr:MHC class II transactivator isoform X2 [Trachemys scripta elegans]
MNLFKEILPGVREILSSATTSDVHALLSCMLEKDVISKEYHQTLLQEKDREDLARKISLTLVEKWDLCLNTLVPLRCLKLYTKMPQDITDNESSLNRGIAASKRQTMDSAVLTENSFLDLLHSNIDPLHLYSLLDTRLSDEDEESELSTDPEIDTINHDQFSNLDVFYTMESNESVEESLFSNTGEAYSRIAGLAEYVLKDQQERQMEDIFAFVSPAESYSDASKPKSRRTDAATRVKERVCTEGSRAVGDVRASCQKRVESPGSTVNGSFVAVPLNSSPANSTSLSHLHMQFSVTSIHPTGKNVVMPVSSGNSNPDCLLVGAKGIQVISSFAVLPQQIINLPVGNGASNIIIYPVSSSPTETLQISPVFPTTLAAQVDLAVQSILGPPDKNTSIGPFAYMPETAAVTDLTDEEEMSNEISQIPVVPSEQILKRPKPVEAFCTSLKDYFQDVCKFMAMDREVTLDHFYIDGALMQGQTETKSGKNVKVMEKELVIYNLEEKEKAAIERSQIFQVLGGKELETKVIVVLGKAGMGKSILVQKICQDWSNGKFSQFEFVFWFECRRLSLPEKQYSLKDLLLELFVKPREGSDKVFEYILQNPNKVLLIFDGFEELQDHDGFTHCSDCQSYKELYSIRELFAGLFQKKILSGCTLLLTARPKDKFNQYLSKVDKIIEMIGFSPQQVELYIARYFEGLPYSDDAVKLITDCQYLFSHCYSPVMCRFICFLCEMMFEMGDKDLPPTLTSLFVKYLQQKLTPTQTDATAVGNQQHITRLAWLAWHLGEKNQNALKSSLFPSKEVKEFALKYGLVLPFTFPKHSGNGEEEFGSAFSDFVIQNFLSALHLLLAEDIKDKSLTKYLSLPARKKKPHNWLDLVPRFLPGLLYLQHDPYLCSLSDEHVMKIITKKQKTLLKYIKKIQISDLYPEKLLELLHCVYETQDSYLLQHVALRLKAELSFLGTLLTPPDVYVLHFILKRSPKEFSLDLRNSGINLQGLKHLVGLKNVTSFRASLSDTVRLWESLEQTKEYELLKISVEKFDIDPFKAETMKDIRDLSDLVRIQEKMVHCMEEAFGCNINEIPAIKNLRKLEFALGPACGLQGFLKLVEILAAFPSLQHLDLDALSENEIGDVGTKSLCEVLSALTSLETLNLSQNKITDLGAEQLATALPSLSSLKTLSLYNNYICDAGAENIAKILPAMASLRVLHVQCNKITDAGAQKLTDSLRKCPHIKSVAMWNPTIPYGVLEHLQQLDSRISLL